MTDPLVALEGIEVRLKDDRILSYPDLQAYTGQNVQLSGPSGIGKSTLLNVIAGLQDPSAGRVMSRACRIAFAFQEPRLIGSASVLENIKIGLRGDVDPSEAKLTGMIAASGLSELTHAKASTLSVGEAQRVNLLRALVSKPDLLLLDEIGANLDDAAWARQQDIFEDARNTYKFATIQVSHARNRVMAHPGARIERWVL